MKELIPYILTLYFTLLNEDKSWLLLQSIVRGCFIASEYLWREQMMKKILATAALLSTIVLAAPVKAENPTHMKQLLETNECAECDLVGADLTGAHLIGADLRNANLQGAILAYANLEGADLTGANLRGADLTGAFVNSTSLNAANLINVDLSESHLYSADVTAAVMSDITLVGADVFNTAISVGGGD